LRNRLTDSLTDNARHIELHVAAKKIFWDKLANSRTEC